jgi:replicative DNA helicase
MAEQKTNITSPYLRMPPQDLEAEMSVLGSVMLDGNAIVQIVDILIPEDFYREDHSLIYGAMCDLFSQQAPIDVRSVGSRLKEKQELEKIGGHSYLTELVNCVPSVSNAKHYAEIVRKKSILRHLIEAANHINQLGFKEEEDLDYLLDEAEQKIFNIARLSYRQNFLNIEPLLNEAWERLDRLHKSEGGLRGVPTGFPDLDQQLSGLQKSDLIILAARPSFGKTSLALDIARHAACEHGIPVGIFSLEMSSHQLVDRLLAAEAFVDSWNLRTGRLTDKEDFSRIQDALGRLSKAPIYIEDAPSLNVLQMRAMARRLQAEAAKQHKNGLGLLIVDYIQLITPRRESDNPVREMTEISRSLKTLSRELNIPVLALSQLSRAVEHRNTHIPRLSDLRESGAIEQDADLILFIHREDKYQEDADKQNENVAEIHIAKHRNGPTGMIKLYFNPSKASFTSLDKHTNISKEENFNVF